MEKMPLPNFNQKTKVNKDAVNRLLTAYSYGCTDVEACLFAGISRTTLYKYMKKHPDFKNIREDLKQYPVLYARQCLFDHIKQNPTISLKILEKLAKEYKQTQEVKLDGESFELTLNKLRKSDTTDKDNISTENKPDPIDTPTPPDDPEPTGG